MELLLINPPIRDIDSRIENQFTLGGENSYIRSAEHTVNPGLLSIASFLSRNKVSLRILDIYDESAALAQLNTVLTDCKPRFVGISCGGMLSYRNCLLLAKYCKMMSDDIIVIIGGTHAGPLGKTVFCDSPNIDILVKGEGELPLLHIARSHPLNLHTVRGILFRAKDEIVDTGFTDEVVSLDDLQYDYSIWPDTESIIPVVEVSRGCWGRCIYCSNTYSFRNRYREKKPEIIVNELKSLSARFDRAILLALSFGGNRKNLELFIDLMKKGDVNIEWKTETRVDANWKDLLKNLVQVGCRGLDLGLESASPRILKLMQKTNNPAQYLSDAIEALAICEQIPRDQLILKMNLLFFPGEVPGSLRETLTFICKYGNRIDIMGPSVMFSYPGLPFNDQLQLFEKEYGTSLIKNNYWDSVHAYPINPSRELPYDLLKAQALLLCKMFSSEQAYLKNKIASKFPWGCKTENLKNIILSKVNYSEIPFSLDIAEHHQSEKDSYDI